jgi:hypothetical protein
MHVDAMATHLSPYVLSLTTLHGGVLIQEDSNNSGLTGLCTQPDLMTPPLPR